MARRPQFSHFVEAVRVLMFKPVKTYASIVENVIASASKGSIFKFVIILP